jgi:hypothetical protein
METLSTCLMLALVATLAQAQYYQQQQPAPQQQFLQQQQQPLFDSNQQYQQPQYPQYQQQQPQFAQQVPQQQPQQPSVGVANEFAGGFPTNAGFGMSVGVGGVPFEVLRRQKLGGSIGGFGGLGVGVPYLGGYGIGGGLNNLGIGAIEYGFPVGGVNGVIGGRFGEIAPGLIGGDGRGIGRKGTIGDGGVSRIGQKGKLQRATTKKAKVTKKKAAPKSKKTAAKAKPAASG